MAKTTPVITHVEILCCAIRHLERELEEMENRCYGKTDDAMVKAMLDSCIAERTTKIQALKDLYRIETGTEY